jgi:hypothetical protein
MAQARGGIDKLIRVTKTTKGRIKEENQNGRIRCYSEEGKYKKVEAGACGKRKDSKGVGGRQASALMGKHSTMAFHCASR